MHGAEGLEFEIFGIQMGLESRESLGVIKMTLMGIARPVFRPIAQKMSSFSL